MPIQSTKGKVLLASLALSQLASDARHNKIIFFIFSNFKGSILKFKKN